jgi:hypothetical protein
VRFPLRAKRILTVAAAGALALSMLPAGVASADRHEEVCGNAPDSGFPDKGAAHGNAIDCMYYFDVIDGRVDGTFGTFRDITRGATAKVFVNFALTADEDLEVGDEDDPFTDKGNVFDEEINAAWNLGLVDGVTSTTYEPAEDIVRGQFAKILYEAHVALGTEFDDDYPEAFDDTGDTYRDEVNALAGEDIITGFADGTFRTWEPITRGAAMSLLARSAGLLHDDGNWDGGAIPPEAPDTNQTFTVTPADETTLATSDERDYEASGFGADTDSVVLDLADADNVTVSDGIVTFITDEDDGDFTADFGDVDATITDVEVDGTVFPGYTAGDTISVDADSEVSFTVEGEAGTDESVIPVVFEGDDADALPTDEDGDPLNAFGIGGVTNFTDIDDLTVTPATSLNPFGTDHTVTATLVDGDDDPVAAEGQEVTFEVLRYDTDGARTAAQGADIGTSPSANTVLNQTVTVVDGEAVLTYTGPDNPETGDDGDNRLYDAINVEFEGAGSYDEVDFDGDAAKDWSDEAPTASTLELSPEDDFNQVSTSHTFTATVTDQYGDTADGVDVRFEIDRTSLAAGTNFTFARTTNASGEATLTYTGPAASTEDVVTATALDEDADPIADADDTTSKFWYEVAAQGDDAAGEIVYFNTETTTLITDDGADEFLLFDYSDGELFSHNATARTQSQWVSDVESALDADGAALSTTGYLNAAVTTQFDSVSL